MLWIRRAEGEAHCWTWRKGSSSFVEDIIVSVVVGGGSFPSMFFLDGKKLVAK